MLFTAGAGVFFFNMDALLNEVAVIDPMAENNCESKMHLNTFRTPTSAYSWPKSFITKPVRRVLCSFVNSLLKTQHTDVA